MSNESQHNAAAGQVRPMSKVRNIVVGVLAGIACLVTLAGCGDSIEDRAKPVIEELYNRDARFSYEVPRVVFECQKIVNLEEIGLGRYRGTVLMKMVDLAADEKEFMESFRNQADCKSIIERNEKELARLQRGEGCVKSCGVYIEDLEDSVRVELFKF